MEQPDEQPDRDTAGPAKQGIAWRKTRDFAWFIPVAGVVLLVSPLLNAVTEAGTLGAIPANVIYVFGIWFALILATARLARRLRDGGGDD